MRSFLASGALALASACTIEIPTDPGTFNVEPGRLSHLRRAQAIEVSNGYSGPSTVEIRQSGNTFIIDHAKLTNTAIAMLSRAMSDQGIAPGPGGDKRITLRILQAAVVSAPNAPARVSLEARFGDGRTTTVTANNRGFSAQRALDGAVLFALNQLLVDVTFIDYVNK